MLGKASAIACNQVTKILAVINELLRKPFEGLVNPSPLINKFANNN